MKDISQFVFLIFAAIIYFMYAYISFSDKFQKDSFIFFVISMAIGFLYSLLWYWSSRIVSNKTDFLTFVFLWDFVYIAVFYFMPIFFFGVKMDKWGFIGMASMVFGLVIMKIGHK